MAGMVQKTSLKNPFNDININTNTDQQGAGKQMFSGHTSLSFTHTRGYKWQRKK